MAALAILLFCVLAAIAAIHLFWAIKDGDMVLPKVIPFVDGKPAFIPSRSGTALVAIILFCMAVFVLAQQFCRSLFFPDWFWTFGGTFLAMIFIGRAIGEFRLVGFYKKIRDSEFAYYDTRYWSPLCLVLGIGILYLACA